ncbi:MAG: GIY-YIG nuclease family protein [Nitrososphaerales archaeon]|nr:GIY-YIG nuclease family protein [Nitrososphaerales archaeon]
MRKRISDADVSKDDPEDKPIAATEDAIEENLPARHFVYIVECSDRSLYTGYTMNPSRRVTEHNRGTASRYTRTKRPVKLVYLEELADRAAALKREVRIKRLARTMKLQLCLWYEEKTKRS